MLKKLLDFFFVFFYIINLMVRMEDKNFGRK